MVLGWKRPGRVWICQAIVASLAQSVEHAAVNRSVNGSSPLGSAILIIQHTAKCVYCYIIIFISRGGYMKIKISWKKKEVKDTSRMGLMYCFKSCSANQN